jgi:hypothetical protein
MYPLSFGYPGFSAGAFLRSGLIDHDGIDEDAPDLQLTIFPVMIEPHLAKKMLHISYDKVLVTVAVVNPRTRFHIKLVQSDVTSTPRTSLDLDDGDDDGKDETSSEAKKGPQPEIFYDQLDDLDVSRLVRGVHLVRLLSHHRLLSSEA